MTGNSSQWGESFQRRVLDVMDSFDSLSLNWTVVVVACTVMLLDSDGKINVTDNTALMNTVGLWILMVN